MVRKVWKSARVIWQRAVDDGVPEAAILAHIDNGGTIVLEQENQSLVISPAAVPELVKVLRTLQREADHPAKP
jgi:hypothetical protein